MKILYGIIPLILIVSSCVSEFTIDDVTTFRETVDTTRALLSKLSKDGRISTILIHDSVSELSLEDFNINNYCNNDNSSKKRIWKKSIIIDDLDSVEGMNKTELAFLKSNLNLLFKKYNVDLVTSQITILDKTNSNDIYLCLQTYGGYHDERYLSFMTEKTKHESWFQEHYDVIWEKEGLLLFKHR